MMARTSSPEFHSSLIREWRYPIAVPVTKFSPEDNYPVATIISALADNIRSSIEPLFPGLIPAAAAPVASASASSDGRRSERPVNSIVDDDDVSVVNEDENDESTTARTTTTAATTTTTLRTSQQQVPESNKSFDEDSDGWMGHDDDFWVSNDKNNILSSSDDELRPSPRKCLGGVRRRWKTLKRKMEVRMIHQKTSLFHKWPAGVTKNPPNPPSTPPLSAMHNKEIVTMDLAKKRKKKKKKKKKIQKKPKKNVITPLMDATVTIPKPMRRSRSYPPSSSRLTLVGAFPCNNTSPIMDEHIRKKAYPPSSSRLTLEEEEEERQSSSSDETLSETTTDDEERDDALETTDEDNDDDDEESTVAQRVTSHSTRADDRDRGNRSYCPTKIILWGDDDLKTSFVRRAFPESRNKYVHRFSFDDVLCHVWNCDDSLFWNDDCFVIALVEAKEGDALFSVNDLRRVRGTVLPFSFSSPSEEIRQVMTDDEKTTVILGDDADGLWRNVEELKIRLMELVTDRIRADAHETGEAGLLVPVAIQELIQNTRRHSEIIPTRQFVAKCQKAVTTMEGSDVRRMLQRLSDGGVIVYFPENDYTLPTILSDHIHLHPEILLSSMNSITTLGDLYQFRCPTGPLQNAPVIPTSQLTAALHHAHNKNKNNNSNNSPPMTIPYLLQLLLTTKTILPLPGHYLFSKLLNKFIKRHSGWTFKCHESWRVTLCHVFLLRRRQVPWEVMLQRILSRVLSSQKTSAVTMVDVSLYSDALNLRLKSSSTTTNSATNDVDSSKRESLVEIFVKLIIDPRETPTCVSSDNFPGDRARLVVAAKGALGNNSGATIWKGGFQLVLDALASFCDDGMREVICPDCISCGKISQASSWSWLNRLQMTSACEIFCQKGHSVDTQLLKGIPLEKLDFKFKNNFKPPVNEKLEKQQQQNTLQLQRQESSSVSSISTVTTTTTTTTPPPLTSLLKSVVLVGLWDDKTHKITNVGSGFIVDSKRGLIITAAHTMIDMTSHATTFGQDYHGLKNGRAIIGVVGLGMTRAVFRYFAEIVAKDARYVDACVLRITARMERDVERWEDTTSDRLRYIPEIMLKNDSKRMKKEMLVQLDVAKEFELGERVRLLGFNQGGEGWRTPGTYVDRCIDYEEGYVCKMFELEQDSGPEESESDGDADGNSNDQFHHHPTDVSSSSSSSSLVVKSSSSRWGKTKRQRQPRQNFFEPRGEIVVKCTAMGGHSGGPFVNYDGEVIGILSRADEQRCYLVPAKEWEGLVKKARSLCKSKRARLVLHL